MKNLLRVLIVGWSMPFAPLPLAFVQHARTEGLTFEIIRNGTFVLFVWIIVLVPLVWLAQRAPASSFDVKCLHCSRLVNRWRPHRCFDGQRRRPF